MGNAESEKRDRGDSQILDLEIRLAAPVPTEGGAGRRNRAIGKNVDTSGKVRYPYSKEVRKYAGEEDVQKPDHTAQGGHQCLSGHSIF